MKISVSLPDPLFREAEKVSKRLGVTRSELYRRALESFLQDERDREITAQLNLIYGKDSHTNRLDPVLEEIQARSISKEEW